LKWKKHYSVAIFCPPPLPQTRSVGGGPATPQARGGWRAKQVWGEKIKFINCSFL